MGRYAANMVVRLMPAAYRKDGKWFVRSGRIIGECRGFVHMIRCYWRAFIWERC